MCTRKNAISVLIIVPIFSFFLTGTALLAFEPGVLGVVPDEDGDRPGFVEVFGETTVKGNPLDDGDEVFGLRGGYRLFSGTFGLEAGLAWAEPTSQAVQNLGSNAELLLLDFSAVWYLNYEQQEAIFKSGSSIKPEVFVFAGPGLASLKFDGSPGGSPLDDSEVFFTLNAGIGAKLHWFRTKDFPEGSGKNDWDRRTSRLYLRPEIRARWFHGDIGNVDWTVGLALGISFGDRPTCRSLGLQVDEALDFVGNKILSSVESRSSEAKSCLEPETLRGARSTLVDLKSRIATYGGKCSYLRQRLDSTVEDLNKMLEKLRETPGCGDPS